MPRATCHVGKLVLVVGESGVGKSSIINMLYNDDHSEDCCKTPCLTGSTASSVTKASSLHLNMRSQWCFVDTVGVGDPEMDNEMIIKSIRGLLKQTEFGVDRVLVVMKMERVPAASRANVELLQGVFSPQDLKSNAVLVLTHWDGDIGQEEADLKEWVGADTYMASTIASFSKVILTNNKLGRGAYPEARQACLANLRGVIGANLEKIYPRPVNLGELVASLISKFGRWLWKPVADAGKLVQLWNNTEGNPLSDILRRMCCVHAPN